MSGRGKVGKNTGGKKVGAKRHRRVLRSNIQGVTKPAIRRIARRAGVKRISGLVCDESRCALLGLTLGTSLGLFVGLIVGYAVSPGQHASPSYPLPAK